MQPFASYWYTMSCEAGRISEVLISGTSVSVSHMTIRTSALHVEEAFSRTNG